MIINPGDEKFVESGIRQFAQDIVNGLKTYFPEDSCKVLDSLDVFHLDHLIEEDDDEWDTYGHAQIDLLVDHYGIQNKEECQAQWRVTRLQMLQAKKNGDSTNDFWANHLTTHQPEMVFPDLHQLVRLFLVVVLSSVHCERVFSQMNLTKSKFRSSLSSQSLNDLLMIKFNGPECEGLNSSDLSEILEKAFVLWMQRRKRLPKRARTDPRPKRKAKSQSEPGLEIERDQSEDDNDDFQVEGCVCDGGGLENPVLPVDHFKTVSDRKVLIPPVGYTVMDVPMSVDLSDVKTRSEILLSGREKGGKIALQLDYKWYPCRYLRWRMSSSGLATSGPLWAQHHT